MRSKSNYAILVAMAFLQGLVFYAPIATPYRQAYGLELGSLFLIESLSWILTFALEAPWGRIADRIGCRATLIAGSALYFGSKLVFATAYGFWGFLAERCVLAVALAALSGCSDALLYRSAGRGRAERAFGLWQAATVLGLVAASAAAPLLYLRSMRAAAWATALPYAAAAVLSFFLKDLPEEEPRGREPPKISVGAAIEALARDGSLLALVVICALASEAAQAATVFLAPLQLGRSGLPSASFGPIFALLQAAGLAGGAAGAAARLAGRARAMRLCVCAQAAALSALALSHNAVLSVAALAASRTTAAMLAPLAQAEQNDRVRTADRATALSVNAMAAELVGAAVNVGVGQAAASSLGLCFGGLAILLGAAALAPRRVYARGPGD